MLTSVWLVAYTSGLVAIFALALVFGLLRFLFGRSRRLDDIERAQDEGRGPGIVGLFNRLVFYAWSFLLMGAGSVVVATARGGRLGGCAALDGGIACSGLPGADAIAWILSLPATLGQNARTLFDLERLLGGGVPVVEYGIGLIGPLVVLIAWIGFAGVLGDIGRLWRRGGYED